MGKVYRRGKIWYIDVRYKSRRIRKAVGSSKKIAELALKDAEVKIAKDKFGFAKNDLSIDKFFERFDEYSEVQHRSTSTDRYRAVVSHFQAFLRERTKVSFLSEVTTELIDRYKVYRKSSWVNGNGRPIESESTPTERTRRGARANTVNFELDALRMVFNVAIKWGYLTDNPAKGIQRLKVDDAKAPRFLTEKECRLLLDASPLDQRRIFFTFLNTGVRKSELENLQWQDVDFERNQIRIRAKEDWKPKSGERDIPINPQLRKVLREMHRKRTGIAEGDYVFDLKHRGRSRNWMRTQLIQIAAKAGIEDLTKLHTLRHTFASHLVMNGVDLPTVQKLMGHSDIETTMIYAHLAPEHLAGAVNKLKF